METGIIAEALRARAMCARDIAKLSPNERERVLNLRGAYMQTFPAEPKETTDLGWREYYLKEAKRALKDGLPITAKQCIKNAELFKKLSTGTKKTEPLPTTKDV